MKKILCGLVLLLLIGLMGSVAVPAATLPKDAHIKRVVERSQRINGEFPDWQAEQDFYLNDLRLFMTSSELEDILGDVGRSVDDGFNVYSDTVVIRLRDGLAVNISVTGELYSWKLQRDGIVYATIGDAKNTVLKRLGDPFARYVRPDKPWEIYLYASRNADIGLFMINDQVAGFMLTEPGLLGFSLMYKGFKSADVEP